jgi:cobalt-zinc-cadmium efflux system protein
MSAHDDAHDHSHAHAHHHEVPENFDRAFLIGIGLNLSIVVGQVVFGFLAHSLALLADAAHNFSDVIGLVLAFAGAILARRTPSARFTYGLRKASVLAALANAALLLVATGGIIVEAIQRFFEPAPVANGTVVWVAAIGMVLNGVTALLFLRGRNDDLNLRGAFLHMTADAVVSLGVVVAALVIMATGWLWIDPAMGLVIAGVILWSSWDLTRDTTKLALDAVPESVDRAAVEAYLRGLPGTTDVHDLHIWGMSTRDVALTVHLVRPGEGLDDHFLGDLTHELQHRFGIAHATVQIEAGDPAHPCALAPENVI